MPFGRWRGHRLDALPDGYLEWLRSRRLREPLRSYVEREHRRRFASDPAAAAGGFLPAELRDAAGSIVTAGYHALARQVHPDHGGSNEDMRRVNDAAAALRRLIGAGPRGELGR
jgi:hypothetical protein